MAGAAIPIQVECLIERPGGEEVPCRIWFGRRQVTVTTLVDRWLAPDHRYFKLLGDDRATYLIRHDVPGNRWELILYEAGNVP
ncbi:MAG: hypothetical protein AB1413_04600 [Thermodesulfobacteriota bacterium]